MRPRPNQAAFNSPVLAPKASPSLGSRSQPPPTPQRSTPSSDKVSGFLSLYIDPTAAHGTVSRNDFEVGRLLGQGSSGVVYRVTHRATGRQYALKQSKKKMRGECERDATLQEVATRAAVPSPRLVRIYNAWQEQGLLFILMELCRCDLNAVATQLDEALLWKLLRDCLACLADVHAAGFVHGDVKPDNLYLAADSVRLGDFGLMCRVGEAPPSDGDARYLPSEAFANHARAHPSADVFSLGISFYELITQLDLPPNGDDWQALRKGKLLRMPPQASPLLVELLQAMMSETPEHRPTSAALLRHPTFAALSETTAAELDALALDLEPSNGGGSLFGPGLCARSGSPDPILQAQVAGGLPVRRLFDVEMDMSQSQTSQEDNEIGGLLEDSVDLGPPSLSLAAPLASDEAMPMTGMLTGAGMGCKRPRALFSPSTLVSPRGASPSPSPTISMLLGRSDSSCSASGWAPQPPVLSPRSPAFSFSDGGEGLRASATSPRVFGFGGGGSSSSPRPLASPSPSPRPASRNSAVMVTPRTPPRMAMSLAATQTPATPVRCLPPIAGAAKAAIDMAVGSPMCSPESSPSFTRPMPVRPTSPDFPASPMTLGRRSYH